MASRIIFYITLIALFGFLLTFCSSPFTSVYSWNEMVKLQDGSILPITRSATRTKGQAISHQSVTFESQGESVTWEDHHKWLIDYNAKVLDFIGKDPVIVLPVYRDGPCAEYNYPEEGLVAFRYRKKEWERIPTKELPQSFALNLLQSEPHELEHWPDPQSISITLDVKDRLQERYLGGPLQGASIASMTKYYSSLGPHDSCVTIRPPPDSKRDAARTLNFEALNNAKTIQATLEDVVTTPQKLTNEERYPKRGIWTGAGYLGNECKGIVERLEPMYEERNKLSTIAGYQFYLLNEAATNRQVQLPYVGDSMNRLMCDGNNIYALSRQNKSALIFYHFSNLGELKRVIKIALPDAEKIRNDLGWGDIWNVKLLNDELKVVLVDGGGNESDVLNRQQIYKVTLE